MTIWITRQVHPVICKIQGHNKLPEDIGAYQSIETGICE
jgi:hypothetical protein